MRYFSTKLKPQAGHLAIGNSLSAAPSVATPMNLVYNISWTFDITYRGLRADSSDIVDNVALPE